MSIGKLDDLMDALGDAREAAGALGQDPDALSGPDKAIHDAVKEKGIKPEKWRFLFGPAAPGTVPTSDESTGDLVSEAGHMLDNLGISKGFGKLGAEAVDHLAGLHQKQFEKPRWAVHSFACTEGLQQLFRCEVTLVRVEKAWTAPASDKIWDSLQKVGDDIDKPWQNVNVPVPGLPGLPGPLGALSPVLPNAIPLPAPVQQARDIWAAGNRLSNDLANPDSDPSLKDFSDKQTDDNDPDALDHSKIPVFPSTEEIDPDAFLDQVCSLCIARRLEANFTLTERWFTGIGWEFEDLGYVQPAVRMIRVVFAPRLLKLSLRTNCRIFQDKTAVQIIQQVLKDNGLYDGRNGVLRLAAPPLALGPLALPGGLGGLVSDVVGAVGGLVGMGGAGAAVSGALAQGADKWGPKREYCVQYNETDLDFVLRLMEEEGIAFFFEHAERKETLVLCDDPATAGRRTHTVDRTAIPVWQGDPDKPDITWAEKAWNFHVRRQMVPAQVLARDWNLSYPTKVTEMAAGKKPPSVGSLASSVGDLFSGASLGAVAGEVLGNTVLDHHVDYADPDTRFFEYPGRFVFVPRDKDTPSDASPAADYGAYDGPNVAKYTLEALRAAEAVAEGTSAVTVLLPGYTVQLQGAGFDVLQMNTAKPAKFLVTTVEHTAVAAGAPLASLVPPVYKNHFRCVYADGVRFRPAVVTPRPAMPGVQTALVLDPDSAPDKPDAIRTDRLGRVQVRFHWDRRPGVDGTEKAHTAWLRVAHRLAGPQYGTVFVPRPGMEAVVGFLDGDPDRPLVVGAVYNGYDGANAHVPELYTDNSTRRMDAVPAKTQAVIRSRSHPRDAVDGGPGYNQLLFDDHGGREQVALHAQRDLIEEAMGDHVTAVKHDQTNAVVANQTETVGLDQTLHVTSDPTPTPDPLKPNRDKRVAGDEEVRVGKDGAPVVRHELVSGCETVRVAGARTHQIDEDERVEVKGVPPASPPSPPPPTGAAAPAPGVLARELTVFGSNTVTVTGREILTVAGDRSVSVDGELKVFAKKVEMHTPGEGEGNPPPPDPESRVQIDEHAVLMDTRGSAALDAGRDLTLRSETRSVVIRAEASIEVVSGKNLIRLNAVAGTIDVRADPDHGIELGVAPNALRIRDDGIEFGAPAARITTTAQDGTAKTDLHAGSVKLYFEGEIHLNAKREVNVARSPARPPPPPLHDPDAPPAPPTPSPPPEPTGGVP